MEWDSAITLAFAAEHLFEASQLLTIDLVPANEALHLAHSKHILPLLENACFLPGPIREKLIAAHKDYLNASAEGLTRDFAQQLASELMEILAEVTATLTPIATPSFLRIRQDAA
ncbi:MAG TPA: hypothetical protein VG498_04165 [Terriglobales bacterium]|nr:hypothetical protein [Terriglobales bacterium]